MLLKPIASYWQTIQRSLFPGFADELGPATDKHLEIMVVLDMVEIERFVSWQAPIPVSRGRPGADRAALARAFIAKAILNLPSTKALIDRLKVDAVLRRLCGFEKRPPCEATFSNAFAEFAEADLPAKVHEAMIRRCYEGKIVGHVCRDSTAIEAREKYGPSHTETEAKPEKIVRKNGRPKTGESAPPRPPTRLDRHMKMTLTEMLADLPKACNRGGKKDSKGNTKFWVGYKLHVDCGDGGIPLSCVLTSASLHDSQVAIALETMTSERVTSLYSLMDAAYDCAPIHAFVAAKGKVPIIDPQTRRNGEKVPLCPAKKQRYRGRTAVERVNAGIKDDFGGRHLRVRSPTKVFAHLMFGVLALTAERLITVFS
jgi:hypothetical protein